MSLEKMVLQKVADWRPTANERQTLTLPHAESGWTVHLIADRCDEIGCLLWEAQVVRSEPTKETLAERAQGIAARVKGLLEPLCVVEIDASANQAQVRSDEPTLRDGNRLYYEVRLIGAEKVVARRYRAAGTNRREQIAFALTHEVLARFVQDLAG